MKISDYQNQVEHEGIKGKFVEFADDTESCYKCCYDGSNCDKIPCDTHFNPIRKDGKDGYFKLVEVAE